MDSDVGSQPRQSILTSFLRSRPRSAVHSQQSSPDGTHPHHLAYPPTSGSNNTSGGARLRGRQSQHAQAQQAQLNTPPLPLAGHTTTTTTTTTTNNGMNNVSFTQILRRRRSGNNNSTAANPANPSALNHQPNAVPPTPSVVAVAIPNGTGTTANNTNNNSNNNSTTAGATNIGGGGGGPSHRIRLVPHLENARSLHFDPITRECREGATPLRIGRFTDRNGATPNTNSLNGKIAFKSKVVSRGHAEIWHDGHKFFIKDTSSSSGTFLNHTRLSLAGMESRAFELKDGDILQLGVDYQGGTEEIYRCVKIRVEIGREWQSQPNAFNTNALAQLRALSNLNGNPSPVAHANSTGSTASKKLGNAPQAPATTTTGGAAAKSKTSVSDCCICLFPVTVCQALFIAPCSHSFHYKCIRGPLLEHHPGFSCPLCRSFHDLEADVEIDLPVETEEVWEELPTGEEVNIEVAAIVAAATTTTSSNGPVAPASADVTSTDHDPGHSLQPVIDDMEAEGDYVYPQTPAGELTAVGITHRHLPRPPIDDDDHHLAMQTAAEDNDRTGRLFPGSSGAGTGTPGTRGWSARAARRTTMVAPLPTGNQLQNRRDQRTTIGHAPVGTSAPTSWQQPIATTTANNNTTTENDFDGASPDPADNSMDVDEARPATSSGGIVRQRSRSRVRATLYGLLGGGSGGGAASASHLPQHTTGGSEHNLVQSRGGSPVPPVPPHNSHSQHGIPHSEPASLSHSQMYGQPSHSQPHVPSIPSSQNQNIRRVPVPAHLYTDHNPATGHSSGGVGEMGVLVFDDSGMSGGEETGGQHQHQGHGNGQGRDVGMTMVHQTKRKQIR